METKTIYKKDVYQIITDRIIAQLEKGVVPWQKNWKNEGIPTNLITLKPYRGINILLLSSLGFSRNYFLTFKQLKTLGGTLKEGEKSIPVCFWKYSDEEQEAGKDAGTQPKKKVVMRYYLVYNIEQCEGLPVYKIPLPVEANPIVSCERIAGQMPDKPKIQHKGNMPFYSPANDVINMPPIQYFDDAEAYYETLFHELIHSTGHIKRLGNKEAHDAESKSQESYSVEELIAEIGACFLKSIAGIKGKHDENSVAYIYGWLNRLKNNQTFIVYASTMAQQRVDFILNTYKNEGKDETQ